MRCWKRLKISKITFLNKIIEVKDFALVGLDKLFKEEMSISKANVANYKNITRLLDSVQKTQLSMQKNEAMDHQLFSLRN